MCQWTEYGDPSTTCSKRLGGIMPGHEAGSYEIAEALLAEVTRIETTRPLKLVGDTNKPDIDERIVGLEARLGSPGSARFTIPAAYVRCRLIPTDRHSLRDAGSRPTSMATATTMQQQPRRATHRLSREPNPLAGRCPAGTR
jgi:hypothetical protein